MENLTQAQRKSIGTFKTYWSRPRDQIQNGKVVTRLAESKRPRAIYKCEYTGDLYFKTNGARIDVIWVAETETYVGVN